MFGVETDGNAVGTGVAAGGRVADHVFDVEVFAETGLQRVAEVFGQLRGVGCSVMPMIVSLTGACLLRVVWILTVFAQNHTLTVLYLSYPVSWFVTFAAHFLCYWFIARKRLGKGTAAPVPE